MKTVRISIITLFLLLILNGCVKQEYKPLTISKGVDICNMCNMFVPDDKHATQIQLTDGKYFLFDDIGCHHKWLEQYGNQNIAVQYVRDYHTEEWLKIESATFVYDKSFKTPMEYGIYSFINKEEATAFTKEKGTGTIFTFNEFDNHHFKRHRENQ